MSCNAMLPHLLLDILELSPGNLGRVDTAISAGCQLLVDVAVVLERRVAGQRNVEETRHIAVYQLQEQRQQQEEYGPRQSALQTSQTRPPPAPCLLQRRPNLQPLTQVHSWRRMPDDLDRVFGVLACFVHLGFVASEETCHFPRLKLQAASFIDSALLELVGGVDVWPPCTSYQCTWHFSETTERRVRAPAGRRESRGRQQPRRRRQEVSR